jgi:hypothetical protein
MAISESDALAAVKTVISNNGGEVDHDTLMNQLIQNGAFDARSFVREFVTRGMISSRLVAQSEGKPLLIYTDATASAQGGNN